MLWKENFGIASSPRKSDMKDAPNMERATRFLESARLRSELFEKLNTPGSIIRLESPIRVMGGQVDLIYNHPNYINMRSIRKKLECTEPVKTHGPRPGRLHVSSAPGIGSSHYLVIEMLYTLIERYHEPGFNVIFVADKAEMYSYLPSYGWTRHRGWFEVHQLSETNELYRNNTYQFIDSVEPESAGSLTLLVSPNEGKYCQNLYENGCEKRSLPAWTLEELLDAYSKLKDEPSFLCVPGDPRNVTEESIRREFEIWGGIPRIIFHSDLWCDYSMAALLRDVRDLTDDSLDDLKNEGGSLLRHRLFHYCIDPVTFRRSDRVQYASPLIQILVELSDASENRGEPAEARL